MSTSSNPNQPSGNQPNFNFNFTQPNRPNQPNQQNQPNNASNEGGIIPQQLNFAFGARNESQAGGDEHAVFNFTANQGGPNQRLPASARWTLEERRNHWQNKNPIYHTTASANIEPAGDGTLCITNKRTKRIEDNSVLIEPADPSKNRIEKWAGSFTGTQGPISMAKHFAATHPPNTKTVALIVARPGNEDHTTDTGDLQLNLLPSMRGNGKRKADEGNVCANCHKNTHVLADCVWPYNNMYGDIFGCPICNTKDHRFDDCHNQDRLSDWNKFEWLVLRRGGKCMIRSDCRVYELALRFIHEGTVNPAQLLMPWTRNGAINLISDHAVAAFQNWDYSNPQQIVTIDPNCTPESLQALSETSDGGSFSGHIANLRHQRRDAAGRPPQPPPPYRAPQAPAPYRATQAHAQRPVTPQLPTYRPDAQWPQSPNTQPQPVNPGRQPLRNPQKPQSVTQANPVTRGGSSQGSSAPLPKDDFSLDTTMMDNANDMMGV
ncbi:hypothetical protein F4811DRAFT_74 [Daldinia bambusicola]|nr:hypothetical protein F4811DRAFT_74 [Daldinia bambusicola]